MKSTWLLWLIGTVLLIGCGKPTSAPISSHSIEIDRIEYSTSDFSIELMKSGKYVVTQKGIKDDRQFGGEVASDTFAKLSRQLVEMKYFEFPSELGRDVYDFPDMNVSVRRGNETKLVRCLYVHEGESPSESTIQKARALEPVIFQLRDLAKKHLQEN